jgi:long-chain acyl-CoA synthetase
MRTPSSEEIAMADLTEALERAVAVNPAGTATVDGGLRRSWTEVLARVARLAGALRSLGIAPGERVAILALNSPRYLETYFAAAWAGGLVVPISHRLTPYEVAGILSDAEARLLIADKTGLTTLASGEGAVAALPRVLFADEGPAPQGLLHYEAALAAAQPLPRERREGGDIAGLFYTGGTTGAPKGVMLSHANLMVNAAAATAFNTETVYLHATPLFHLGGVRYVVAVTVAGGAHAFLPRFDPAEALRRIGQDRVTATTLVPAMVSMLVNSGALGEADLSSLTQLRYGGSPIPEDVLIRAMRLLPRCGFSQGYGMTESASVATILGPKQHVLNGPDPERLRSAGLPHPGAEIAIVDDEGRPLAPGAVGEIVTRGPHVMQGYWRRPDLTALAIRGGWLHTGDLGYLDGDGFLYIVDRRKDTIIANGENVYSVEVESTIQQLPAVAQCAVIGLPHAKWGEAVHAVVVPRPGMRLSAAEVLKHCRRHLAGYKCPRSVDVRAEPLPVGANGKVLKHALRAPYWAGMPRQVN